MFFRSWLRRLLLRWLHRLRGLYRLHRLNRLHRLRRLNRLRRLHRLRRLCVNNRAATVTELCDVPLFCSASFTKHSFLQFIRKRISKTLLLCSRQQVYWWLGKIRRKNANTASAAVALAIPKMGSFFFTGGECVIGVTVLATALVIHFAAARARRL